MGAAVAFAGWPWSVATTGVMRVAMALAMAASLLLVNANHHWAAMAVGVCVQAVVALLLVRACALRDESDGASHVRFALLLAPRLSFFLEGEVSRRTKFDPVGLFFSHSKRAPRPSFFLKKESFSFVPARFLAARCLSSLAPLWLIGCVATRQQKEVSVFHL